MRRTAQALAVAAVVIGMGLTALPATAQTHGAAFAKAHSGRSGPGPTPAQRAALQRARHLMALRHQHGSIVGLVRGPDGAPEANVCVAASNPLATRKAYTKPDGQFVINGLPKGAYRVEYRGCSPVGRFTGQWYGGLTRNSAKQVMITGSSAPVILAPVKLAMISPRFLRPAAAKHQLSMAQRTDQMIRKLMSGAQVQAPASTSKIAHISGQVTTKSGRPLARICVLVTSPHARFTFGRVAVTSKTGRYQVKVGPGRYIVDFLPLCARKGNFAPQFFKAAGSQNKAMVLHVKARQKITHVDAALGTGAVITGSVHTLKNPHPSLAGLCAEAFGTGGQQLFLGEGVTRKDGTFRLPSLATGRYHVAIFPGCSRKSSPYLPVELHRLISVTNGKVTSGVTAVVKLGGTISGTVKDAGGSRLAGICVDTFSERGGSFAEATTGKNGTYRLLGLRKGSYEVDFRPGCGNRRPFAPFTYPSAVNVRQGKVTAHIDAVMQLDGSLSGTVTNSKGQPQGGICVLAESSSFGFAFARTHADGTYQAKRVPPGNYDVEFIPGGQISDCGNKGNYLPVDLNATVASNVNTTLDAQLPTGGVIKGVVRDPHGKPVAGICVFSTSEFGGQAVTASNGSYQLRQLTTGDYFVGFEGGCGNRSSVAPLAYKADPTFYGPNNISVIQGKVTSGINVRLRPGGTITGRVTDQAGKAVSGVCILAEPFTGGGVGFFYFLVERGGRFSLTNLAPGQYALVFFGLSANHRFCGPSPYAIQQFFRQGNGAPLDLVSVPGGKVTAGVNARLTLSGKITGVVRSKAGQPIGGICVTATNTRTGATSTQFSNRHGQYSVGSLTPGRYQVEFSSCGGDLIIFGLRGLNWANQWYKGHSSQAAADTVIVRPTKTTANINASLTKGGTITGQVVYQPTKRPIYFTCVFAYTPDFSTLSFSVTDRRGRYLVDGLSSGRYILEFDPCAGSGLAGQIRPGRLQVMAGQVVHNVNEQIKVGGSVSGVTSVRLPGGRTKRAPGTCVELLPLSTTASAAIVISLGGGSYLVPNLAAGKYQILAGDPACTSNAPTTTAQLTGPVSVTSAKTTKGANVSMRLSGTITGVVRGPGGKPITGICVEAVPTRGGIGIPAATTRAAGGSYRIADLQPGSYKVKFTDGCGANGFATRWYKNARTQVGGKFVRVSAASVTSDINQTLPRS
ncbi:MAG TPA: carboxypeptidase-like regulatory domain-containing protein [Streptosporangiaceae bacterium]|nr:carboxypeptidase-like regulatory domain-containing protein [Streptosporangiaceae bacterium]